ncbi:MAG: hypothetical protein JW801_13390 [Bacteroidales bacterium]|nr:hypothetical protein [Bacteroidales bacterium]
MEPKEIKSLLDKYYAGETSLEEEVRILEILNSRENIPGLEQEQEIFRTYSEKYRDAEPPENLEAEMLELINGKWRSDNRHRFSRSLKWAMGAAAALLILLIAYNRLSPTTTEKLALPTKNEQQAFTTTKNVLTYVSQTINTERSKLESLSSINKGLSSLNELSLIDQSIRTFKNEQE